MKKAQGASWLLLAAMAGLILFAIPAAAQDNYENQAYCSVSSLRGSGFCR